MTTMAGPHQEEMQHTFRALRFVALPSKEWRQAALRMVEETEGKAARERLEDKIMAVWPGKENQQ